MSVEICRLYLGSAESLPPQGQDGVFNVIDEVALRSTKRNNPQTPTQDPETLAKQSLGERGYSENVFLEKFVKPVHIVQSPFERIVFPAITALTSAAIESTFGSVLGVYDSISGLFKGLTGGGPEEDAEVANFLEDAADLLSDPSQLIAVLLSKFYVVEVLLPEKATCIPTPAYGHLVRKPATQEEVTERENLEKAAGQK